MTVIRPNSVSGITSITAQANEINVFRSNGLLAGLNLNGVNFNTTAGISTLAALKVTGNVDIAGVLTYQDVTNVDSLGIGTFRTGINVSGGQLDVGSNIKLGNAGVVTATSFVGSGANLTGLPAQTTINSNTNNYLITGTGTANTLQGEANLTFDGVTLSSNNGSGEGTIKIGGQNAGTGASLFYEISGYTYLRIKNLYRSNASNGNNAYIEYDAGYHKFLSGKNGANALRIDSDGKLLLGHTSSQLVYANAKLQIQGTDGNSSSLSLLRHGNSPYLILGSTGGSSLGDTTAVSDGNRLGQLTFVGADGSDIATHAASIAAYVDGSVSSSNIPAEMRFQFGAAENNSMVRISTDGLSVKNNTNTSALCINNVRGTASAPSFNETNADGFLVDVYNTGNPYPRYVSLAARGYGSASAEMSFWTDPGSDPQKRMTISPTGNIGIKLTDPQEPLNVKGTISTGRNLAREVGTIINISSDYAASRGAANVINGSKNYEDFNGNDWITANGQRTNANFTLDLGAQYTCDRLVIYNQNEYSNNVREVKRFTFEGSNDNSSWTTLLDTECGASYAHEPNPGFSFRLPSNYIDDNEGVTYRYWRFTMKDFHGSTSLGGIMELELYEHAVGEATDDETTSEITSHAVMASDIYAQNIYHDLPAFFACRTSSLSISNQTNTVLAFVTTQGPGFDTSGYYDNSNYRFNPKIPGYYQINMCCSVSYGSLQAGQIYIYKNGSPYAFSQLYNTGGNNYDDICLTISTLVHLDGQSDYVDARAWRNGGNGGLGSGFSDQQWSGYLVRHAGYRRHGDGAA